MAEEEFSGDGAALLLTGLALHTDLAPDSSASSIFGWLLAGLGQQVGFPVPEGGAGPADGGAGRPAGGPGRAGGVRHAGHRDRGAGRPGGGGRHRRRRRGRRRGGRWWPTSAPRRCTATSSGPSTSRSRVLDDLRRFQYDNSTVKVDWALDGPIPWAAEPARRAGTVHLAEGMDHFVEASCRPGRRGRSRPGPTSWWGRWRWPTRPAARPGRRRPGPTPTCRRRCGATPAATSRACGTSPRPRRSPTGSRPRSSGWPPASAR